MISQPYGVLLTDLLQVLRLNVNNEIRIGPSRIERDTFTFEMKRQDSPPLIDERHF